MLPLIAQVFILPFEHSGEESYPIISNTLLMSDNNLWLSLSLFHGLYNEKCKSMTYHLIIILSYKQLPWWLWRMCIFCSIHITVVGFAATILWKTWLMLKVCIVICVCNSFYGSSWLQLWPGWNIVWCIIVVVLPNYNVGILQIPKFVMLYTFPYMQL
jgi:hypothetical protein